MTAVQELDFIINNMDELAHIAEGLWIDPLVRPKSQRKKFTVKGYEKALTEGVAWWKSQDEALQARYLSGLKEFAVAVMAFELFPERVRWIHSMMCARPDPKKEHEEREHKLAMKALRDKEYGRLDPMDANIHCWNCGKFMHLYDEKNNKRHEKEEICTCESSHVIQRRMADRVSAYRKHLKEREQRRKKTT